MTNIDIIKQMNAEEMAQFLKMIAFAPKVQNCREICKYKFTMTKCYTDTCENGIKAWLEQEVEE